MTLIYLIATAYVLFVLACCAVGYFGAIWYFGADARQLKAKAAAREEFAARMAAAKKD